MKFVIYTANCTGNAANCEYPHKIDIDNPKVLQEAVKKDHVCACYKDNRRSKENFIASNVIVMDIDNDHTNNEQEYGLNDRVYFNKVYKEAAELCAYLCKEYGLTEKDIICHSEGYKKGIASNHGDVMHWFPKHGKSMDTFRADVKKLLSDTAETAVVTELTTVNDIVWELARREIISDNALWLKKLEEDTNSYWLARKTANYLRNKNV